MIDTCTITRVAQGAFNDTTGRRAETSSVVFSGVCRVKVAPITQAEAGDRKNVISSQVLVLPLRSAEPLIGYDVGFTYDEATGYDVATDVEERDIVTITASTNADMIGMTWSIVGGEESSTATARMFKIERRA